MFPPTFVVYHIGKAPIKQHLSCFLLQGNISIIGEIPVEYNVYLCRYIPNNTHHAYECIFCTGNI